MSKSNQEMRIMRKKRANERFWRKNWQAWIVILKCWKEGICQGLSSPKIDNILGLLQNWMSSHLFWKIFLNSPMPPLPLLFKRDCLEITCENLTWIEYEYLPGFRAFFGKWNLFLNNSANSIVFIIFTYNMAITYYVKLTEVHGGCFKYHIWLFYVFWSYLFNEKEIVQSTQNSVMCLTVPHRVWHITSPK